MEVDAPPSAADLMTGMFGSIVRPRILIGLGVLACVPCCIGPLFAIVGTIAVLGLASTLVIGGAGLLIVLAALVAMVAVRHRAAEAACRLGDRNEPVPVELTHSPR